jgi:2-hydroxy-6-oxo-octa-2,4-dienoate hydrolase
MQIAATHIDRWIQAGGVRTHYLEAGDGEPLLLLHGSGPGVSAVANWGDVIAPLARNHRVLALDFAGFGSSEQVPAADYGIRLWQRQLIGFLDALELDSVTLLGNSFGGAMALALAARRPERVQRLILMGTPVGDYELTAGLRGGREFDGGRDALRAVLANFPYDPELITEELIDARLSAAGRPGAQDALQALVPAPQADGPTVVHGLPEAQLAAVSAPTLILHGRDDRVVPFELGLRLLNGIADSELHAFGKCGHWVQLERRRGFLDLVLTFTGQN